MSNLEQTPSLLLHLTTAAPWRAALSVGSLVTPSLVLDGFIHLSRADQVALPANRLFAGRDDVLLLVIDPARLTDEVRWEPGVPTDPASMRFPHLYGPLPTGAVTSVLPYRPGDDGDFHEPIGLPAPTDIVARAAAFDRSLALRRAAVVLPVTGGVAVLDPRVRHSYEHNTLWIAGDVTAAAVLADADRVLAEYGHRRAVFDRTPPAGLGWEVEEQRLLVLDAAAPMPVPAGVDVVAVTSVTSEVMGLLWGPSWRRSIPGISDEAVEDLLRREAIADAHLQVVDLAVLGADGIPVAGTQLRIDGATADIEAVMTHPEHRSQGFANALVGDAVRRARAAGCDVIWLVAVAEDWPRRWYERLGFVDVGARWEATVQGP